MSPPDKNEESKSEKKKVNKKTFWDKKFNKKLRVQQWESKRQKYIVRKYQKELKKSHINHIPNSSTNLSEENTPSGSEPFRRLNSLKSAKQELERRKEEKQQARLRLKEKKEQMKLAIENYKKKKAERFKKLSMKTKRGQPVMKGRLELLLEEIKQKVANDS